MSSPTCYAPGCERKGNRRGLCPLHAARRRTGRPLDSPPQKKRPRGLTLEEAFRWYMPGEPPQEGCWEWTGSRSAGYGTLRDGSKRRHPTHRVSYMIFKGEIPEGMHVLHDPELCNNPSCVNPHHLRVGTNLENQADKLISQTQMQGERHYAAKLTEDEVREIRRRYAAGGTTQRKLADEYGVARSTVSMAVGGTNWKNVE